MVGREKDNIILYTALSAALAVAAFFSFMAVRPLFQQKVNITLPKGALSKSAKSAIVVSVSASHYFLSVPDVNTRRYKSLKTLAAAFKKDFRRVKDINVLIRGDRGIDYSRVVKLMDALQKVGAKSVGLVTDEH